MTVRATEIFERLDREEAGKLERYEVCSRHFGNLRRKMRFVITRLLEADDENGRELAAQMRSELSKWLTVPVEFDHEIVDSLELLGPPELIGARWGSEIRGALDDARSSALSMCQSESPMREELGRILTNLADRKVAFRIYCHRTARQEFESLPGLSSSVELTENMFMHSPAQYRESGPFDVLVKVGPLRSAGWGKTPDAVLTAPRFDRLVQVLWSGCGDEQGFGYDPVAVSTGVPAGNDSGGSKGGNGVRWEREVVACGDDPTGTEVTEPDEDDLLILSQFGRTEELCRCVLLHIDREHGVLYPPQSRVLSVDPADDSTASVGLRLAGEGLTEGMFVVAPFLGDAGLEGLQAEEGSYSRVWKSRLEEAYRKDPKELLRKLRAAGIGLKGLRGSIERWFGPATSVIRAPQKSKHFEVLLKVLELEFPVGDPRTAKGGAWWRHAWREIKRSRGDAIQTGKQEHGDIEDRCVEILQRMLTSIRDEAGKADVAFTLIIPEGCELKGAFLFRKIFAIEDGFKAPHNCLREITELDDLEQWRE